MSFVVTDRADLLALDADALAALANRGLVKRAAREVEREPPTLSAGDDQVVVALFADGVRTELPVGGLDRGTCSCGATTVCRHVIGLVLAYQAAAPSSPSPSSLAPSSLAPASPDSDSDLPILDGRAAGPGAEWSPGAFTDEQVVARIGSRLVTAARRAERAGYSARIRRGTVPVVELASATVRFLVPGDLGYVHTDARAGARDDVIALAVWAFRAADLHHPGEAECLVDVGGSGSAPTGSGTGLEPVLEFAADVLRFGAVHAGEGLAAAVAGHLGRLERAGLRWPFDATTELADQLAGYRERSARYSPETLADLIAELFARHRAVLAAAVSSATPAVSSATPAVSSATPAVSSATPAVSSATAEPEAPAAGMFTEVIGESASADRAASGESSAADEGTADEGTKSVKGKVTNSGAAVSRGGSAVAGSGSAVSPGGVAAGSGVVAAGVVAASPGVVAAGSGGAAVSPGAVAAGSGGVAVSPGGVAAGSGGAAVSPGVVAASPGVVAAGSGVVAGGGSGVVAGGGRGKVGGGLRARVLGTEESAETPLRRVRLDGIGARVRAVDDRRIVEIFHAQAATGVVLVSQREWTTDEDGPAIAKRRVGGGTVGALAAGVVVTESAVRSASRAVRLATSRVARSTVTVGAGAWDRLPPGLLVTDYAQLRVELDALPPRPVRARVRAELVRVLAVAEVGGFHYEPGEQRLTVEIRDVNGNAATVATTHAAVAPGRVDAVVAAFSGKHGTPRYVAGAVHRGGRKLVVDPYGILADGPPIVPDLADKDQDAARLVPDVSPGDPLAEAVTQAAAVLAEAAHTGLAHLPGGYPDRLAEARNRLARVGLHRVAVALDSLAAVLGPDPGEAAVTAWADARIRVGMVGELL
ncbi:hypothetical protein ACTI_01880 [Actinoplanes sp. OR16]|uniref:hypothetical protein n=1 Tax=Actinoplanes sp. OR16 TaxID=946334 RepID=UPI000F6EDEE4|nr:hypothetical protein [Actinoplanes sp. OR16]BBH63503.1 hypothetical protein ACTI_01880 [Actinoplanes sp. OR16]